jgi:hypothetical protein
MMSPRGLPRFAAAIVERAAPPRWRESIIGDLEEEHTRRRSAGQHAGLLWAATAALTSSIRLRRAQRQPVNADASPAPAPNRARFSGFGSELRQMLRAFRQHPGFALITVLTLTLGIGANTIVFSLANWLMFRPVPGVSRPDDLVSMRIEFKSGPATNPSSSTRPWPENSSAPPMSSDAWLKGRIPRASASPSSASSAIRGHAA